MNSYQVLVWILDKIFSDALYQIWNVDTFLRGVIFEGKPYDEVGTFKKSIDVIVIFSGIEVPEIVIKPDSFQSKGVDFIGIDSDGVQNIDEFCGFGFE